MIGPGVASPVGMLKTIALFTLAFTTAATAAGVDHVVGGTTVAKGAFPDAVAVLAPTAACTGTLIAPDVVLTAGHCIEVDPVEVILDTTDYTGTGGEVIRVKSATAYPGWENAYDVGVLVLEHASKVAPRAIASACTAKALVAGAKVEVVGFGLTTQAGTGDNSVLHKAALTVTDPTCTGSLDCVRKLAPTGEFVAGGAGKDACFGDSGGPIYLGDALIGVVSRGLATATKPCGGGGIFVRADAVAPWIEKTTKRKLIGAACPGKTDDTDDEADAMSDTGGCSAGGDVGLPLGLLGLALVRRRRRRQC